MCRSLVVSICHILGRGGGGALSWSLTGGLALVDQVVVEPPLALFMDSPGSLQGQQCVEIKFEKWKSYKKKMSIIIYSRK